MRVSSYVSHFAPDFDLVRNGNQVTATFFYGLEGYDNPDTGVFDWAGDLYSNIGIYEGGITQTSDRPMDLTYIATLQAATPTTGTYTLNDYNDGTLLESEFTVTIFSAAGNFEGTEKADYVFGSELNDTFRSSGGRDFFEGGNGNDVYRIYHVSTKVLESTGQGTADIVNAAVSYALGSGVHIETLRTNSGAATTAINLYGNEVAQAITGNNGDNRIDGKGGADTLRGLGGADTFVFGTKLGGGNIDTIVDFNPVDDRFLLSDAIFKALTPGTITADQFRANNTGEARDATDRIVYDKDSGGIFYDADGLGGKAGVQFATVGLGLAITSGDFHVV